LDKTVIERLSDPLVHIIRNSIDHGIEQPQVRSAVGKDPQGTVHLSAEHAGASVLITISDDGSGLNREAIRSKAILKGLLGPDEEISDTDLYAHIFSPGFSTAKEVSDVSGRGVGMDVVKQNIEALRGEIAVESIEGKGTVITLSLPLTLAIIEGLLVQVGESNYVFPLSVVEGCEELSGEEARKCQDRTMMNVRGELYPYLSLRDLFRVSAERPPIEQVVVAHTGNEKICIGVDRVVGQNQTVIKNLGRLYRDIQGISGATILGDGSVALIIDVLQIMGLRIQTKAA